MSGEIVIGYDGSEGAKAALTEGLALAGSLGVGALVVFGYSASPVGGEVQDLARALREHGETQLAGARAAAEAAGVVVESEIAGDGIAEGLVRLATERGARMIVVGSSGERPLRGVVVGSTPYRLVHLSEVPVLVVRTP